MQSQSRNAILNIVGQVASYDQKEIENESRQAATNISSLKESFEQKMALVRGKNHSA